MALQTIPTDGNWVEEDPSPKLLRRVVQMRKWMYMRTKHAHAPCTVDVLVCLLQYLSYQTAKTFRKITVIERYFLLLLCRNTIRSSKKNRNVTKNSSIGITDDDSTGNGNDSKKKI